MRRPFLLSLFCSFLLLAACGVDTTGLSATSSRKPTGNLTSAVTVTEFGDLQCPACGSAYTLINKPLLAKYASTVKFEFMHFPLQSIHQNAFIAAQASECAADQGKFWEFLDMDYVNQKELSPETLHKWASALKLDTVLFSRCLDSGIKADTINADYALGTKAGVDSTPSYFVNGTRVPTNDLATISAVIDAALKQQQSAPL